MYNALTISTYVMPIKLIQIELREKKKKKIETEHAQHEAEHGRLGMHAVP